MSNHDTIPALIRAALRSDSVLLQRLSGRIHYQYIPQDSAYPHVFFTVQSRDHEDLIDPNERGLQTMRFIVEVVQEASSPNYDTLTRIENKLNGLEGAKDGIVIWVTEVSDVDDQYEFKSADSDALFVHGFTVQVYYTED
jgi:hypothetical protein